VSTNPGQLVRYSNKGLNLELRGSLGIVIASGGFPPVWASNAGHQAAWYRVKWLDATGQIRWKSHEMWQQIELLTEATSESR
jgi:hypothetical protein